MLSLVEATCENEVVKVEGTTVEPVVIKSKGLGESQGLLFVVGDKVYYVASSFQDISDVIDKVKESVDKVADILSSIGSSMTGSTTAPPPTLASDLAELSTLSTELNALKESLR